MARKITLEHLERDLQASMKRLPKAGREYVKTSIDKIEPILRKETPQSHIPLEKRRYRAIRTRRRHYKVRREGTWDEYNKIPLVEDIQKSHVSGVRDLRPRRSIGYGKEKGWMVHFPNYGVRAYKRYPKPQYFIEDVRRQAIPIVEKGAKEFIKEAIQIGK